MTRFAKSSALSNARALDILRGKKQFLEKVVHVLLEKEKINGEE
jgi:hypothetical protein